jgi:hypothetical protein
MIEQSLPDPFGINNDSVVQIPIDQAVPDRHPGAAGDTEAQDVLDA